MSLLILGLILLGWLTAAAFFVAVCAAAKEGGGGGDARDPDTGGTPLRKRRVP